MRSKRIKKKETMKPNGVELFVCLATISLLQKCDAHGFHEEDFDPDSPVDNRFKKDGFVTDKE